jgi:hypothetical protein
MQKLDLRAFYSLHKNHIEFAMFVFNRLVNRPGVIFVGNVQPVVGATYGLCYF